MRALTADQVAAELGRSKEWLYDNWERECREKKMPRPLHEGGTLVWSAAQFYAWLDRDLAKELKPMAAAIRAAVVAASQSPEDDELELEHWRQRLKRAG